MSENLGHESCYEGSKALSRSLALGHEGMSEGKAWSL